MRTHLVVLALAAGAGSLAAQQFPSKPPAPMPITAAQFPPFQETTLKNGLRLVVVENRKLPTLSAELAFPAGSVHDAATKAGTAEAVALLLTKGAGARSADAFAAAVEGVGGAISASADPDFLTVHASFLSADAAFGLGLVADAVMRPAFAEDEVELARTQTLSSLQLEQSQPAVVASRFLLQRLYGSHPYGRRATRATVQNITRGDLVAFQQLHLQPLGALLVLAGDISLARAKSLVEASFAGWTGAAPAGPSFATVPERTAKEILLVHRPGSVQSNVLVGNLTWGPADDRAYAARIANQVLGAGPSSRLFLLLREQRGWTYGANSAFTRFKGTGYFEASTEVRTAVTDSALVELLHQLRRIGTEPVAAREFNDAKAAVTGRFPLQIETAAQVASQVAQARLLGLRSNYVQTFRQRLAAVTAAQARAAANAGITPDAALIVVVGDGATLYQRLSAIAPVQMVTVDGEPLTLADLAMKTVALNPGALAARSDSFAVLLQGRSIGAQVGRLEKVADGWKYSETTAIPMFGMQQHSVLTFSDALEMRETHQTATQGPQRGQIDIVYANGRAAGKAVTPSPTGLKSVDVDAEIPLGAIDDNLLQPLIAAMPFAAGAKLQLAVFLSGKGTLSQYVLTVAGEERVKVLAGEFDAWKVELSGADAPVTMWITRTAPFRVVKIVPVGAPIAIELVK